VSIVIIRAKLKVNITERHFCRHNKILIMCALQYKQLLLIRYTYQMDLNKKKGCQNARDILTSDKIYFLTVISLPLELFGNLLQAGRFRRYSDEVQYLLFLVYLYHAE